MKNMFNICDLHGHFLPGMDDGCKTVEESLQVLQSSYAQGIGQMFATPHYYPVETVEAFLERRQAAYDRLMEHLADCRVPFPEICLGAEVAYRTGISREEDLDKLCLGKSRYLLLELPFRRWDSNVVRDIQIICSTRNITPILAHIERYLDLQTRDSLDSVLEQDVLVQMNAGNFLRFGSRRTAVKLLKNGVVQLLGSDCHNMTTRPPNLGQALEYLQKHGIKDVLQSVGDFSMQIFDEAMHIAEHV